VVIFILGFFWKKATAHSALVAAVASALLSLGFKLLWPDLPFMDRVGLVFLLCLAIAVTITLLENKGNSPKAVDLEHIDYRTSTGFNLAALAVAIILVAFYSAWW
jgi:SSS family solute:Na+ symporter